MDTLTVKLPHALNRKLREKARQIGSSKSELAREWIERELGRESQVTCHDLVKNACGHFAGGRDDSSKEGFGD